MRRCWSLFETCLKSLLPVLTVAVLLAGCQTTPFGMVGGTVAPAERIALPESGQQKGTFETRDLAVAYRLNRAGGNLNIDGTVHFAEYLKVTFGQLRNFNLGVAFVDAQGKVVGSRGLANIVWQVISVDGTLPFQTAMQIPPGTTSIAFTYRGEVRSPDTEGSDNTSIWHFPIRK